ncbi:MAG: ATP-binding protein [Vicinamibacterales bacterium]
MTTGFRGVDASVAGGSPAAVRGVRVVSRSASIAVMALAALALVGTLTGRYAWAGFVDGNVLKANAAVLLIGFAAVLLAGSYGREVRPLRRTVALLMVVVGTLTLIEDLSGTTIGVDELLLLDTSGTGVAAGRPAPSTSVALVTLGLALFFPPAGLAAQGLVLGGGSLAFLALLGYLYDVPPLYGIGGYASMSLNTSLALVGAGVAYIAAYPLTGIGGLLTDPGVAGRWMRRATPAVVVVPALLGWMRLEGQRAGLYGTEFGLALMVVSATALLVALVWSHGRTLRHVEVRSRDEEKVRTLLDSAPDAVVLVDEAGQVLLVNAQTERLFGWSRAELLGQPVERLLPARFAAAHPAHRREFGRNRRLRPMGSGQVLYAQHRSGVEFPVEVSLSPLDTGDGPLVMAMIRDVTEQREMERMLQEKNVELERALSARDRFLATMSHELRTPLNAVIGFTGTMLMKLPGPLNAEQEEQLRIVQENAKQLLSLINDILDIGKVESGRFRTFIEPVEVDDVLKEVVATLRPSAEQKRLIFRYVPPPGGLTVKTDRRALRQVVLNLASNAVKFTEQGSVAIEASQVAVGHGVTWAVVRVRDTGPGIRADDQPRLFQSFEQLDNSRTRRHEGTGLGLYLSRQLAERLGGRIELETTFGSGSTFSLWLPLE